MTTEEFVKGFYLEKQSLLKAYLSEGSQTEVADLIKSMELNKHQTELMKKLMDSTLSDVLYTILLGLDGCSTIGNKQEVYDLKDSDSNQLSGDIEGYAYDLFYED